jgi:hypothetical protein
MGIVKGDPDAVKIAASINTIDVVGGDLQGVGSDQYRCVLMVFLLCFKFIASTCLPTMGLVLPHPHPRESVGMQDFCVRLNTLGGL